MKKLTLTNGYSIPCIGLGTAKIDKIDEVISNAIEIGYSLIDTAINYGNEHKIGSIIRKIERSNIFIISKIQISTDGYKETIKAVKQSLERLGTEYIDLMLIHEPYGDVYGEWRALEELYEIGVIKSIGVSNFSVDRLADLVIHSRIKPMVNQIELHPYYQQKKMIDYCKKEGIVVIAWSPLGQGKIAFEESDILTKLAIKYDKSIQQVILRWHYQNGVITIPRTSSLLHLKENIDIFDFELTCDEMSLISKEDKNHTFYQNHQDPEVVKLLSVLVNNYNEGHDLNISDDYVRYAFGKRYKDLFLYGTTNTRFLSKFNDRNNDKIIRSDCLDTLLACDFDKLVRIGVTDVIDLRNNASKNDHWRSEIKYHNVQFDYHTFSNIINGNPHWQRDIEDILVAEYLYLIDQLDKVKTVFKLILSSKGMIVINCKNGKDRTGVICILIGLLCKNNIQNIIDDYVYSVQNLKKGKQKYNSWFYKPMPNVITSFLSNFEKKYTDIDSYLLKCNLTQEEIFCLRHLLVRPVL